jgi:transcriptional regulator with XRE-family HTH domain
MKVKLGERIRKARLLRGLSQQNMADELGITVASFSNIERGTTNMNVDRLLKISQLLSMSISELLYEESVTSNINLHDTGEEYQSLSMLKGLISKQQVEIELIYKLIEEINIKLKNL